MIATGVYLVSHGKLRRTFRDLKKNYGVLLPMSISDKVAWLAFVYAMTLSPIAVATALSESYIIFAVLLGLLVNREKLHVHQKVGLVGAIIIAIILAVITAG
jgi:drug/metabolite transporter (DMT)-like permease